MKSPRSSRKTPKVSLSKSRKTTAGRTGASISKIRKLEKRLGQKNLAKILGVGPRMIRKYKSGERRPGKIVSFKVKRAEKVSRGLRRTKSIKKKRKRAEVLVKAHPEIQYFEKRENYKYSDTAHIVLYDVLESEIPDLILYLDENGCGAAFIVISGVDNKIKDRVFYSTEIMEISDFSKSWKVLLDALRSQYQFRKTDDQRLDLVGIKYNAPSVIER